MPNSDDVASSEMLWERVLCLLVVGASVLRGSAVLERGCGARANAKSCCRRSPPTRQRRHYSPAPIEIDLS